MPEDVPADLRKKGHDGEQQVGVKFWCEQRDQRTGTKYKGKKFERNHFQFLPLTLERGYRRYVSEILREKQKIVSERRWHLECQR